jgi:hypothetical protein
LATAVYNRVKFVENDTADVLDVEYQGVNVTGFTIELHIGYPTCPLVKSATMTDPVNGRFQFQFANGDLRNGSYAVEILIVDLAGKELTVGEITFDIQKRIKR